MRKFWGWVMFLVALIDAAIIWYNLAIAPWRNEVSGDWIVIPYFAVLIASTLGWYKLALRKKKEEHNA